MLADLRIENLAVVTHAATSFGPGLNVISGETGAGKSILLQALSLATGGRANTSLVRHGADMAVIEARFQLGDNHLRVVNRALGEMGLPPCEDALVVRRQVARDGKSKAFVNDAIATAGALQRATAGLVEQTGQHEQIGLLRPRRHMHLLDAFSSNSDLLASMSAEMRQLRSLRATRDAIVERMANRAERAEFLRFYLQEFEALQPESGEDDRLREQADRLQHGERIREGLSSALSLLYESQHSAYDRIAEATAAVRSLTRYDADLTEMAGALEVAQSGVEEVAYELRRYTERATSSGVDLEALEDRLHRVQRLCRKHGATLDDVITKMGDARTELDSLDEIDVQLTEVEADLADCEMRARDLAQQLTQRRAEAIPRLVTATGQHLADLGLGHCRFDVQLTAEERAEALADTGWDAIVFLFSANPGEPPRPLGKIASGGELSRMLLALKCALAEVDDIPVKVFDEIDSGLGGGSGEIVGRKISQLSGYSQVLCVTHLPQIASFGDTHIVVTKEIAGTSTETDLRTLDAREREEEVARMLGGQEITETTRQHAREMIGRARLAG